MSADPRRPTTTTDSGIRAPSDEHSLTVGPGGPTVLHDHYLVQKLQHFNRVTADVQARVVDYWTNVDADLGARVAAGLGLEMRSAA